MSGPLSWLLALMLSACSGIVLPDRCGILRLRAGEIAEGSLYRPVHIGSLDGTWELDQVRSESMAPFLMAVGAPRLVAWLVGKQGDPVDIIMSHHARDNATEVTIRLHGRDEEAFSTRGPQDVETPRGMVLAYLTLGGGDEDADAEDADPAATSRSFTIIKEGPAADESTTEIRELLSDGDTMKCTFTHHAPRTGDTTTVVRYYSRKL